MHILLLAVGAALVNNVILSQFLGLCPFLGVSKSVNTATGMGGAVIFVMTIASAVTSIVYYGILMTTRYQKERMKGKSKKESVAIAHRISMPSIITSGLSFFAATFGVTCYTQVDMIGSICELLSRGAIISVIVVLTVLPAMFLIFDPVICRTTAGYRVKKDKSKTVAEPTA